MSVVSSPVQSLTWGTQVPNTAIDVYFVPNGGMLGGFTSEGASAYEIQQFEQAYATFAAVANLSFTVTTDPNAYFKIAIDDDEIGDSLDGKMGPPGEDNAGEGIFNGKGIVRGPGGEMDPGGYDFMILIHETLHGLGLSHPHDDGGTSTIMNGVDDAFGDYGDFNLNQGPFTAMTYNNGYLTGTPGSGPDDSLLYGYESGPMALDIAVLQNAYGANMTTATGDETYVLPDVNGPGTGWKSIWDAGGTDEIVYGGSLDATIDLRAATLLYEEGGGGFISSVNGIAGGFTIANGVVIENASSGSGADKLTGNDTANMLAAGAGADIVNGGGGDDMITGGADDDVLTGGAGADSFKSAAGDGDDRINDFDPTVDKLVFDGIETGGAADIAAYLDANAVVDGTDLVITLDESHSVRLVGVVNPSDQAGSIAAVAGAIEGLTFDPVTPGNVPTEGDDVLVGGPGKDVIDALGGNDLVQGGGSRDYLLGNEGNDTLQGDEGNDFLVGGGGDDRIEGGVGDDRIFGNHGNNVLLGGDGDDGIGDWSGASLLDGGDGNDLMYAGGGNDTVLGGTGNDTMLGGFGNDEMSGGEGDDIIYGESGSDFIEGGAGNDRIWGNHGQDTLIGGDGDDRIGDWSGASLLDGGDGNDVLSAGAGNDTVLGGDGNDTIYGGYGQDLLNGGEGDDIIRAEFGNDTLIGGGGNDMLYGGADADIFVADIGSGEDVIHDFTYGQDLISLLDVSFGEGEDQVSRAEFLAENGSIDGSDLFLNLGDGRSIRLIDVVNEEEIGEEAADYEDLFAVL